MNPPRILSQIALVIGVVLFSAGLQTFAVYTPPTAPPPQADAYAPLNTGPTAQIKAGGLLLNTGGALNGLIVREGNVGIGMVSPQVKLDVAGAIKPGNSVPNAECTTNALGSIRYNTTTKSVEFCSPDGGGASVPGWMAMGGSMSFGAWETKAANVVYQAATDGIVVSYGQYGNDCAYTDSSNPPVTGIACDYALSGWGGRVQLTFPVKKGNYWKAPSMMTDVKWLPLLSGGGGGGASSRLTLSQSYEFWGNGSSAGATTGSHDFCAQSGMYQNGNNGWVYLNAGSPDTNGKRNYTVTSTCAAQGCGSGAMAIKVDCYDFQ